MRKMTTTDTLTKRVLVIGQGSIGQRHCQVLRNMGHDVWAVSRRPNTDDRICADLATGLGKAMPDYVVIASATHEHHADLIALEALGFKGQVLVEKPLFDTCQPETAYGFSTIHVAYNLRYHPLIGALRDALADARICSVQAYVGQYLPSWRPGTDYRTSYSAHAAQGGGVLRDLSHELDYLLWIFGDWTAMTACMGTFSSLEIDSDDIFAALFRTARCPVGTVQMNYLDRVGRREITVNTDTRTLRLDLVNNTLWTDGVAHFHPVLDRDFTYRAMHADILTGAPNIACTLADGRRVMAMIEAGQHTSDTISWMTT